ncbi:MAG: hypothetical protein JWO86_4556 [Myxococcaceae bacterium]|nr:hypothetical protein [Myxococcaceae bacterium]
MKKSRFAFVIATSTSLAWAAVAGLSACSTDNGATSSSSGSTGSVVPPGDGGGRDVNVADIGTGGDTSSPAQDAGAECGTAAKLFPPKPDGGIFCPFSAADGGKNIYCKDTEQCCENVMGAGASTCVAKGTACPVATATAWECDDPANCAAGQKCCAHSSASGTPVTVGSDTCGPFLSKFSGTKCAATCATGELVVCEQQSECTTGTCTAVKPKGNDIGVCN